MQTRVLANSHSWGCTKGVDCRIERSRLDRRRAKSVAMKRYRGSREEVKERVEGVAMGEEEHNTRFRAVGQENAKTKKTAQKRSWWKPDGGTNWQYDVLMRLVKSKRLQERAVSRDCSCTTTSSNTHVDLGRFPMGPLTVTVLGRRPSLCPFVHCLFWLPLLAHGNNQRFSFCQCPPVYLYVNPQAEQPSSLATGYSVAMAAI